MHAFAPRLLVPLLLALTLTLPAALAGDEGEASPQETDAPPVRPDILPLDAVRPGMRGRALTVFHGTHLEEIEFEVLDVIRNYLPGQDVILARCLGEKAKHYGIAEGMSGSPATIDGKVVGALAYTWAWTKEPLVGITPIEAMLAEGERPLEGRASGAEPPTPLRQRPPPVPLATENGVRGLRPIGTPVAVSGLSVEGRTAIAEALAPLGLRVRAAGGGLVAGAPAGWADLDAPMVPGAALIVDLVRGDVSISALGTCTYVADDKIYGFGHNFQFMGETLFPISVGYVYTVVPSINISFKLGAPIREVGALIQDRQAGIVGELGKSAPMVPFDVTTRNATTGHSESFHVEITANRVFFNRLMFFTLRDIVHKSEGTMGANSKRYHMTVKLEGVEEPWEYEDTIAGFDTGFSRVLMGLVDRVLIHPTERADFEWVKLDVAYENVDLRTTIESAAASRDEVHPGEEVEILVRLRRREAGEIIFEKVKVRVPETALEGNFVVTVTGGDMVPADVANPVDIADIPTLYNGFYKSTELVAVVPTGRVNLDMGGRLIRNLPLSTIPRLVRSTDGVGATLHPVTEKVRLRVPYIVDGSRRVSLRVRR